MAEGRRRRPRVEHRAPSETSGANTSRTMVEKRFSHCEGPDQSSNASGSGTKAKRALVSLTGFGRSLEVPTHSKVGAFVASASSSQMGCYDVVVQQCTDTTRDGGSRLYPAR